MEEKRFPPEEEMVQKAIDLRTGKDITAQVVSTRLKELRVVADEIVAKAKEEYAKDPGNKMQIFKKAYWEINERIGTGSIGPATAAAGPLMEDAEFEIREALNITDKEFDDFWEELREK